jgi:hypothetical protein
MDVRDLQQEGNFTGSRVGSTNMAACIRLQCTHCKTHIDVWDEGNPYYFDENGRKRYAYHPSPKRNICVGADPSLVCLNCSNQFIGDSLDAAQSKCSKCGSPHVAEPRELKGRSCPYCKVGVFNVDPKFYAIS